MPKKRVGVTLRKASPAPESNAPGAAGAAAVAMIDAMPEAPPAPPEPEVVEAFVSGAAAALEQAAISIPSAKLRELLEGGPEGYRQLTLYLPEKLAQDLSLHCLEHDLDMSRLVASVLEEHLAGIGASQRRRAEDGPVRSFLRARARGLIVDLAHWVREVVASQRRHLGSRGAAASAS